MKYGPDGGRFFAGTLYARRRLPKFLRFSTWVSIETQPREVVSMSKRNPYRAWKRKKDYERSCSNDFLSKKRKSSSSSFLISPFASVYRRLVDFSHFRYSFRHFKVIFRIFASRFFLFAGRKTFLSIGLIIIPIRYFIRMILWQKVDGII